MIVLMLIVALQIMTCDAGQRPGHWLDYADTAGKGCARRNLKSPCNAIRDRSTCLKTTESRKIKAQNLSVWSMLRNRFIPQKRKQGAAYAQIYGARCVWCQHGPCTTNNSNRCEPENWLNLAIPGHTSNGNKDKFQTCLKKGEKNQQSFYSAQQILLNIKSNCATEGERKSFRGRDKGKDKCCPGLGLKADSWVCVKLSNDEAEMRLSEFELAEKECVPTGHSWFEGYKCCDKLADPVEKDFVIFRQKMCEIDAVVEESVGSLSIGDTCTYGWQCGYGQMCDRRKTKKCISSDSTRDASSDGDASSDELALRTSRNQTFKFWQQALKIVGVGRVRKGTADYNKVKKIFDKMKKDAIFRL